MPKGLDQDELIERWTLVGEELERCRAKRGVNGLAFAVLWKFFLQHARFPRGRSEAADEAVGFVGRQLQLSASELGFYDGSGRTIERHRAEVRALLGFRECTLTDQDAGVEWLIEHVTVAEQRPDQVRAELLGWLRGVRVEPPTAGRLDRMVRSALDRGERTLIDRVCDRLPAEVRERLNELVVGVPDDPTHPDDDGPEGRDVGRDLLGWVKTDPGRLSLNTMLDEIAKLEAIRAVGLPEDALADIGERIVSGWRARAAVQAPSHFRDFAPPIRWVLLAALLVEREREITDTLVELLISTVHAINARADRRVTEKMVASFQRVRNKNALNLSPTRSTRRPIALSRAPHEALDTTTPGGRLVFHVFAALAEFIRELIVDGTREGLAAARARGVRLGRPPAMTPEQVRHARDLLSRPDNTVSSIARLLGVSRSTIYKYVPELGRSADKLMPALDVVLAALPEDTRVPPDVTKYDDLLPSRRPPSGGR